MKRALVPATFLAVASLANAAAPTPAPEKTPVVVKNEAFANATDNPSTAQVREWFALGSGCRAKFDVAGDVRMEFLGSDPKSPNDVLVRFHLPDFALDGAKPVNPGRHTFARECSLRFSLFFPKDQRIARIETASKTQFSKAQGAAFEVASQLLVGPDVLSKLLEEHPKEKAITSLDITQRHTVGKGGKEKLPEQPCGTPRIIGFDLHYMTKRDSDAPKVHATLANPKTVDLRLTLETCSPGTTPAK